ncbi:hypothetical protein ACHAXH_009588 [Discostella pseudostelligera]
MNLDKAFLLLFASIGAVAGFTPNGPTAFSVTGASRVAFVPTVRVASTVFSETEQAAESSETVEADSVPAFESTIYVGNISFDTLESDLRAAFAAHGSVSKVQMPTDRNTGRARGFAFVTMSNAEEHAAAIAALNESEVNGRTVYVSESLPKDKVAGNKKAYTESKRKPSVPTGTKIYVGNLNFDTTLEEVKEAFGEFGEVKDVFLPSDYDGNPRGFAFVQMEEENALKAIEGLNGVELGGRTLNVKKSLPKGTKAEPKEVKLYVGNLSWGTEEGALRELFEEYGKVVDCYLPVDKETGQHRGFAFVTMDPNDAQRAADETDGYELDGRILRVNEAQPKGGGASRSYNSYNDGYDGGDAYNGGAGDSWGNEAY